MSLSENSLGSAPTLNDGLYVVNNTIMSNGFSHLLVDMLNWERKYDSATQALLAYFRSDIEKSTRDLPDLVREVLDEHVQTISDQVTRLHEEAATEVSESIMYFLDTSQEALVGPLEEVVEEPQFFECGAPVSTAPDELDEPKIDHLLELLEGLGGTGVKIDKIEVVVNVNDV